MKKKVLLFGPIGDFGGRDVEVNIIAKAISEHYQVSVFSSIYITQNSYALQGLKDVEFTSFERAIYQSNWFLRTLSKVFYLKNKKKKLPYAYLKNGVSKVLFDFEKARKKILFNELQKVDAVIACVQPTSSYLKEAVEFCHQLNKPFFIRTTGTIRPLDTNSFAFLKKVTCFIHHSENNAENLNQQLALPYVIIDQCAQFEAKFLALPLIENQNIYGYLGRLSPEKGILELIRFYQNTNNGKLLIAGDGPLKKEVLLAIKQSKNIDYIGQMQPDELTTFFQKINTLVIPSLEESGPLVGLEAMAAGKLILSTKVGAMEERLANSPNNFWFNIDDQDSFLASLAQIENLSKEDFNRIANDNREVYLADYQFTAIKDKYIHCLKQYLNS
ncbi:glycosyltransferase family 4 protein [Flavobacterium sp.]|uniref:glycosyltransferase family 4 protein n=1 Tax=Flavobacterium sp. TaxID=239 RepID=UPI00391DE681